MDPLVILDIRKHGYTKSSNSIVKLKSVYTEGHDIPKQLASLLT